MRNEAGECVRVPNAGLPVECAALGPAYASASSGYRRIPGTACVGGTNLEGPQTGPCPVGGPANSAIAAVAVLGGLAALALGFVVIRTGGFGIPGRVRFARGAYGRLRNQDPDDDKSMNLIFDHGNLDAAPDAAESSNTIRAVDTRPLQEDFGPFQENPPIENPPRENTPRENPWNDPRAVSYNPHQTAYNPDNPLI